MRPVALALTRAVPGAGPLPVAEAAPEAPGSPEAFDGLLAELGGPPAVPVEPGVPAPAAAGPVPFRQLLEGLVQDGSPPAPASPARPRRQEGLPALSPARPVGQAKLTFPLGVLGPRGKPIAGHTLSASPASAGPARGRDAPAPAAAGRPGRSPLATTSPDIAPPTGREGSEGVFFPEAPEAPAAELESGRAPAPVGLWRGGVRGESPPAGSGWPSSATAGRPAPREPALAPAVTAEAPERSLPPGAFPELVPPAGAPAGAGPAAVLPVPPEAAPPLAAVRGLPKTRRDPPGPDDGISATRGPLRGDSAASDPTGAAVASAPRLGPSGPGSAGDPEPSRPSTTDGRGPLWVSEGEGGQVRAPGSPGPGRAPAAPERAGEVGEVPAPESPGLPGAAAGPAADQGGSEVPERSVPAAPARVAARPDAESRVATADAEASSRAGSRPRRPAGGATSLVGRAGDPRGLEAPAVPLAAGSAERGGGGSATGGGPVEAGAPGGLDTLGARGSDGTTAPEHPAGTPGSERAGAVPVAAQVVARLRGIRPGSRQELSLRLEPPELGRLRIDAVLERSGLNLHIRADREVTCQLLEQALPRLRESLAEHGMGLTRVVVDLDLGACGHQPGGGPGGLPASEPEPARVSPNQPPAPPPRRAAAGAGLDLWV